MPDDENTVQNQDSVENSIPASLQEPMADAPIPPIDSEPANAPSEAPEAPRDGFSDESNNIPSSNSTSTEAENEQKTQEKQAQNEPAPEPVSESAEAPEPETPQIPVNEPLPESEPSVSEAKEEPKPIETPEPEPEKEKPKISYLKSQKWGELLVMARNAMQFRKRKKLDRVMSLFLEKSKITNDEVEKLLHVSDATATRYLSELKKQGKIKQNGRTGAGVSYSRI
jgi:hypothetical protein